MDEPHVEHLVRLIQHQKVRLIQAHGLTVQQVNQPARCGDQQVRATFQFTHLPDDTGPAHDQHGLEVRAGGVGGQILLNLFGQFAGGGEDQGARGFGRGLALFFQQHVDHRQAKGRRLARPGLCQPHHIAAIHGVRDRLGLDRCRVGDALLFKGGDQSGRKAQHVKIHRSSFWAKAHARRYGRQYLRELPATERAPDGAAPLRDCGNLHRTCLWSVVDTPARTLCACSRGSRYRPVVWHMEATPPQVNPQWPVCSDCLASQTQ